MKTFHWLSLIFGALACIAARWCQLLFCYDAQGLPLPSSIPLTFVPAVCFLLFFLLCRGSADVSGHSFDKLYDFSGMMPLFLGICGIFALIASAALSFLAGGLDLRTAVMPLFLAVSAAAMFCVLACLRKEKPFPTTALLLSPAFLAVQLVFAYRACAKDPILTNFYIELLALAALAWAFIQLAAFAFRSGSSKIFLPFAMLSVVLSLTAASTVFALGPALLYAGFALVQLAFLAAYTPEA